MQLGKMRLTREEREILNGSKGEEMAKVMKIVVRHGAALGADRLVDLGGAPHTSLYIGPGYMGPMIKMFDECARAGLKSYAPYTVNPRPYDLYNVNNNPRDFELIYEGYTLQPELEYVHSRLGALDFNTRSCACYVDEVGNAPPPGTYVAWAESSAVNYGNSVLGLRTNRNAAGMELLCALLGKAPNFGLTTDEGRQAKWLVEVRTKGEPDWGVVGTAIGRKVIEDVPYITGLDKYLGGKLTNENMHKLKAMGSATAAAGAVGLYHVENVTPDAKEKGRDLLVEGYQTYVIDDAEQERVRGTFKNMWTEKDAAPTHCFIGCPHNTYYEIHKWGKMVTEAMKKRGQEELAVPMYLFCAVVVRDRLVDEHPQLVGAMKRAGMKFTNMCTVSYASMKGFSDRAFAVTNSAKTRNYSTVRYFPDDVLLEIVLTGAVPANA
jgi:predicted aconitase